MDYTALIAAWNSTTQPPTGVTGQPLVAGDSTNTKITKINGWTVAAPQPALLKPSDVLNAIVDVDLAALTTAQVNQLSLLLSGSEVDASKGTTIRSTAMGLFGGKTQTIQKLAALVAPFDNATKTWCEANSYPFIDSKMGNLSVSDAQNAGLT